MISYFIKREREQTPNLPVPVRTLPAVLDEQRLRRQTALAEGEPVPPNVSPLNQPPEPHGSRWRGLQQQNQCPMPPAWIPEAQRLIQQERERAEQEPQWGPTAIGMGKHGYAKYLNMFVYPRFFKGQWVTFASEPFVPTKLPRVYFQIGEIQEIHYMATMDKRTRSPKCLGLLLDSRSNIPTWYPVASVRNLQPEELKAVDDLLRNQASSRGSAWNFPITPVEPTNPDDPSVGKDPERTGVNPLEGESRPEEGDI